MTGICSRLLLFSWSGPGQLAPNGLRIRGSSTCHAGVSVLSGRISSSGLLMAVPRCQLSPVPLELGGVENSGFSLPCPWFEWCFLGSLVHLIIYSSLHYYCVHRISQILYSDRW
ncbi:hypothetical protein BGZ63DRAFT_38226 [Mariannaea sp. PMI_226]|nr:hypothetical protein BGZ63DRAFT_38226 [Mariannaea sp. PMI_226]